MTPLPVPDTESRTQDDVPAVDVPECVGGCGQPWATPDKHLQALFRSKKFGMTSELLCHHCWQKQVRAAAERAEIGLPISEDGPTPARLSVIEEFVSEL